jgi:hypothetical protein
MLINLSKRSRVRGTCAIFLVFLVIASVIQSALNAGPPPEPEIINASLGDCLDPVTFDGDVCEHKEDYCVKTNDGKCQVVPGATCQPGGNGPKVSCKHVRVANALATGECVSGQENTSQMEEVSCTSCGAFICASGTGYTTALKCKNNVDGGSVVGWGPYRSCNAEPEEDDDLET